MPKVTLGYIHSGTVSEPFLQSVLNCISHDITTRNLIYTTIGVEGVLIAAERNALVERFLEDRPEWLWMIDTDIEFDKDILYRLIDTANAATIPIVSALYFSYVDGPDLKPVWFEGPDRKVVTKLSGEAKQLSAVGMGCCLIHRSVLEKMRDVYATDDWPWFAYDVVGGVRLSEDISFCLRATKLGFPIWGNGSAIVNHIKPRRENLDTFMVHWKDKGYIRQLKPIETNIPPKPLTVAELTSPDRKHQRSDLVIASDGSLEWHDKGVRQLSKRDK